MVRSALRDSLRPLAWAGAITIPPLAIAVLINQFGNVPIRTLTADTNSVLKVAPYVGLISNLGLVLWTICGAICIHTATCSSGNVLKTRFLRLAGVFSLTLMLDDLLQVHETLLPRYLRIPEAFTFGTYAIALTWILLAHRRPIQSTRWLTLAVAMTLFVASIGVDSFFNQIFLEDAAKFLGIGCWCMYFVSACTDHLRAERLQAQLAELAAENKQHLQDANALAAVFAELTAHEQRLRTAHNLQSTKRQSIAK